MRQTVAQKALEALKLETKVHARRLSSVDVLASPANALSSPLATCWT
jgi:hypothetical protein